MEQKLILYSRGVLLIELLTHDQIKETSKAPVMILLGDSVGML